MKRRSIASYVPHCALHHLDQKLPFSSHYVESIIFWGSEEVSSSLEVCVCVYIYIYVERNWYKL